MKTTKLIIICSTIVFISVLIFFGWLIDFKSKQPKPVKPIDKYHYEDVYCYSDNWNSYCGLNTLEEAIKVANGKNVYKRKIKIYEN